jgi:hypothetical protein
MRNGKVRAAAWSLIAGLFGALLWIGPAAAQESGDVVPNPGPDGSIPGSELITEILGWLKYAALASAVAGLLVGGVAIGVGYSGANYAASNAGRRWLMGGLGAAVLAGLAHTVAITLYEAT